MGDDPSPHSGMPQSLFCTDYTYLEIHIILHKLHWSAAAGFSEDVGADEAPFNVLLTTYTLFERDSEENKLDRAFLKQWRWSCLMLDEAHAVKNRSARRTTNLNRCLSVTLRQPWKRLRQIPL
jgi:SWI/SNF-related matrix-associated actin-dependent regulator 1 of chromatin subfamily A